MFSSKMADADAEATETIVWLDFGRDCGYLMPEDYRQLTAAYEEIGRMLHVMITDPEKFAPRGAIAPSNVPEDRVRKASLPPPFRSRQWAVHSGREVKSGSQK
jgi:hypothetical protein